VDRENTNPYQRFHKKASKVLGAFHIVLAFAAISANSASAATDFPAFVIGWRMSVGWWGSAIVSLLSYFLCFCYSPRNQTDHLEFVVGQIFVDYGEGLYYFYG
jgi:hypothetical protein